MPIIAPKKVKFEAPITTAIKKMGGTQTDVDAYLALHDKGEPFVKATLNGISTPDMAVKAAEFVFAFKFSGIPLSKSVSILANVLALDFPDQIGLLTKVVNKGAAIGAVIKKISNPLEAVGFIIAAFSAARSCEKADYGSAIAEIYKSFIGITVPFGGAVDVVQSIVDVYFAAPNERNILLFKVIRACDPVGLGGVAIQSFVWFIQAVFNAGRGRSVDEKRLSQLVDSMKSGPARIFVDLGERAEFLFVLWDLPKDIYDVAITSWDRLKLYLR